MTNQDDQLLSDLRSTLSKMELSLDVIDDAIVWVDDRGIIKWNNEKFSELLNTSTIQILGNPIQSFLTLKSNKQIINWNELLNNPTKCINACIYEWQANNVNKYLEITIRDFHKYEKEINIVIVLRDVTQNHLNEIVKSKLAAIVESTDDAIIGRTLDGLIESWNKGAENLYGYKAAEVLGKSVMLIYPENLHKELPYTAEQIKLGHTLEMTDTERVHKDGHLIPVSVMISPIFDDQGKVVGSCSIARDISALKEMMKMKNDFISTVSHELRTPLTSVQGSLSLLVSGAAGELPDKAQKLLKIGKENTERLIRLINDILDIQKIESGKLEFHRELVNIGTLVQEALLANQPYAEKFHLKINLIQKSTAMVNIDRDRILQVLANLISNAVKFSNGSDITIRILEKENKVRIEVINQGIGIPKEFHSRIFQKFSQIKDNTNTAKSGTGLGLNISKEIIEKHGGVIGFESEENKETIFYFELPTYKQALASENFASKTTTALICSKDRKLSNYLQNILEKNSVKTFVAHSTAELKKLVVSQHIDAVLLDLTMPDQDGIALIKELKNMDPHLSIVVLSVAPKTDENIINGNVLSILDWIEKPIDLHRLLNAVKILKRQAEIKAPNILHVEDDVDLMQIIASLLQPEANMFGVTTLKEARKLLEKRSFDLVILDLILPDGSGIDLLPTISKKRIPVLVFSAYELPENYADYVVKTLIKTQTSPTEFVNSIEEILK